MLQVTHVIDLYGSIFIYIVYFHNIVLRLKQPMLKYIFFFHTKTINIMIEPYVQLVQLNWTAYLKK